MGISVNDCALPSPEIIQTIRMQTATQINGILHGTVQAICLYQWYVIQRLVSWRVFWQHIRGMRELQPC